MVILAVLTLSSCKGDSFEKQKLCSRLHTPYSAELDFIISNTSGNTSGKASVTKSDTVSLYFTEPEDYSKIKITSDSTGKEDTLSFEFSGIPATIPKSIARDISLMFSLFSDDIPAKISELDEDCFKESHLKNKNGNALVEVYFSENDISYRVLYDKYKGFPHAFDAGNDEFSVSVTVSDFKVTEIQNKEERQK